MKCCVKCFQDSDIIARIEALQEKGNCDICHSKNVLTLDLEQARDNKTYAENFVTDFEELVNQFTTNFPKDVAELNKHVHKLTDFLALETSIFNLSPEQIDAFFMRLLKDYRKNSPQIFNELVIPTYLLNEELDTEIGIFKGKHWSDFEEDIRHQNRFHSKMVNEEQLIKFFQLCTVKLQPGSRYVRARISDTGIPLPGNEMGKAPEKKASSGRLNAVGIGYLCLCQDKEVALSEIKASVNDVCTIATYEVPCDSEIRVVDLSQITNVSYFMFDNKDVYLMNQEDLLELDNAMKTTSDRNRSEVAYVPTEYISDLIKSMGVDGISYKSSLVPDVRDVVLFAEDKVEQISNELISYQISGIKYTLKKIEK